MTDTSSPAADRFFCWWGKSVLRFPRLLLCLMVSLSLLSLYFSLNHLGFDMDTSSFLSEDLPFQKNRKLFDQSFPEETDCLLILVESATAEQATLAARQLRDLLNQKKTLFSSSQISNDNKFFNQQAFLYLSLDELEQLSNRLSEAQPFIGHLAKNYHLPGLFDILGQALRDEQQDLPMDLTPLFEKIDQALIAVAAKKTFFLSWQELLSISTSVDETPKRRIVIAKPIFDFKDLLPSEAAMRYARQSAQKISALYPSTRIRITGGPAMEHDELESLGDDMAIAGLASLFLVCCTLWVGLRSFKLMLITLVALVMGLCLTAGFATLSVGHLNVLSVAFAVLYIGLGVDFSLHLCLRYRECREHHISTMHAIEYTVKDLGFSLFLCALTTSIGFFAFIPTHYAGVSELGIISGGGMFIGFFISIIVLPILLKILPLHYAQPPKFTIIPQALYSFPFRHKKSIRILALLSAIGATIMFTQLSFDSNPVNLRNPNSESVIAFRELLNSKQDSPFALFALSPDLEQAETLAKQFQQLESVSQVMTLQSLVPDNQSEKLAMIDDLGLLLGSDLEQFEQPLQHKDTRAALLKLQNDLNWAEQNQSHKIPAELLWRLQRDIQALLHVADNLGQVGLYQQLDNSILGLLPFTMQQLNRGLTAYAFMLADLPDNIRRQWQSAQGIYKIMILPQYDLNQTDNLKTFVHDVQSIDSSITGYPVIDIASGQAVAEAFIQAFISALLVIFLILLVILRSFRNTLLVIGPLLLATVLTGALNVLLDNPFNFANSIAIPLLMGMGVDSGIHIMHRLHVGLQDNERILQTSTARGVFFSSLTTLFSFTSLAFIPHAGIASMGLLLAIGISFTLLCTLIVLPAFSNKHTHY